MIVKKEEIKLGLCKGRHDIPQAEDGFIFESISDPTDTKALEKRLLCHSGTYAIVPIKVL